MPIVRLLPLYKQSNMLRTVIVALCLASSIAFSQAITSIAVNDDETLLLTAQEKTAKLWEIDTGKVIREFSIPEDVFSFRRESKYSGNIYATEFVGNNIVLAGVSSMIYFLIWKVVNLRTNYTQDLMTQ